MGERSADTLQSPPTARPKFFHMPQFQNQHNRHQGHGYMHQFRQNMMQNQNVTFDGKRMRKAVYRKTVDYNSSVINHLENRIWQRDFRDHRALPPDSLYVGEMVPPPALNHKPMNCVDTRFIRVSTNKIRCPIFCVAWTPEGRRLITGASSGEFTLWNGLAFNFETILQAHDTSVRAMVWSHNDLWMLTADHGGFVKYWQSNMNNVKMYQAHKDPIRGIRWACWEDVSLYASVLNCNLWMVAIPIVKLYIQLFPFLFWTSYWTLVWFIIFTTSNIFSYIFSNVAN